MKSVAIVGAGLSGLTAGYRLQQAGWQVDVFEATNAVAGRVQTVRRDRYAIDIGASALGTTYRSYIGLAEEIGVQLRLAAPVVGVRRSGLNHHLDMNKMVRSGLKTPFCPCARKGGFPASPWTLPMPRRVAGWTTRTWARPHQSTRRVPVVRHTCPWLRG